MAFNWSTATRICTARRLVPLPTHHLNNATSTTTHLHIVPVFSTNCSRWWSAVGSRSGAFIGAGCPSTPTSRVGQVHPAQLHAKPQSTPSLSKSGESLSTNCTRRSLGSADYLFYIGGPGARQQGAQPREQAERSTYRTHRRNAKAAAHTRRSRVKATQAPRQTRIGGLSQSWTALC